MEICGDVAAGYLFTYWHTKQTDERKANIDRINEQLRELYGPLLASVTATQSAYTAMVRSAEIETPEGQTHNQAFRRAISANPKGPEAESYRCGTAAALRPARCAPCSGHGAQFCSRGSLSA